VNNFWTCACGATNAAKQRTCEFCGESKAPEPTRGSGYPCQDCKQPTSGKLGAIVVNERYLCPQCRWQRLERQKSQPTDRCGELGCDKTVAEHIAEFKQRMARVELKSVKL